MMSQALMKKISEDGTLIDINHVLYGIMTFGRSFFDERLSHVLASRVHP